MNIPDLEGEVVRGVVEVANGGGDDVVVNVVGKNQLSSTLFCFSVES
jgi:hypothetical protein